jgi:hypothetical protein
MATRIGIRQMGYRVLIGLVIGAGITLIGVGAGLGMPAVIIGGVVLIGAGCVGFLFQGIH